MSAYTYAEGDLLEVRNNYGYSAFQGQAFLDAWRSHRDAAAHAMAQADMPSPVIARKSTDLLLERLARELPKAGPSDLCWPDLDRLVHRFEVSKRLHGDYTPDWRPADESDYACLHRYVRFVEVLEAAYLNRSRLTYLNALLKCLDTLVALQQRLDTSQARRVSRVIASERRYVEQLEAACKAGLCEPDPGAADVHASGDMDAKGSTKGMHRLNGVVLLAADSARSRAYIQALVGQGMLPQRVILYGDMQQAGAVPRSMHRAWRGVLLPDLSESVSSTCARADVRCQRVESNDIDSPGVRTALLESGGRLVIYSGKGGQIVSRQTLGLGLDFLHMHSGLLPNFRGSTTLYYMLLSRQRPAVTALLLDPHIDTGPVVATRSYPVPPAGLDLDQVYDGAIRADLLVRVLQHYARSGMLPAAKRQMAAGETYYVIHPVLKHIAILSLQPEPSP